MKYYYHRQLPWVVSSQLLSTSIHLYRPSEQPTTQILNSDHGRTSRYRYVRTSQLSTSTCRPDTDPVILLLDSDVIQQNAGAAQSAVDSKRDAALGPLRSHRTPLPNELAELTPEEQPGGGRKKDDNTLSINIALDLLVEV